jgi:hypothetical protein
MRLSISTKPGLIGIRTTPGKLNIETIPARLNARQEIGRISVNTKKPKLEISQYEAMAQMGYKKPSDVTAELAQTGKQKALQYIAAKAEEGRRLQAIEKGGNPIREIAIDRAWPGPPFVKTYIISKTFKPYVIPKIRFIVIAPVSIGSVTCTNF